MSFYAGQRFTAPAKSRIRLADGSVIELEKGGSFTVGDRNNNRTELLLGGGSLGVHLKHLPGGRSKKFDVVTRRAVAGARGRSSRSPATSAKQQIRLAVEEGEVSPSGRAGRGQPQGPERRGARTR